MLVTMSSDWIDCVIPMLRMLPNDSDGDFRFVQPDRHRDQLEVQTCEERYT
jgi:hypothetical protein